MVKLVDDEACTTEVPVPKVVDPEEYVVPSTGVGGVALVLLTTKYPLGAEAAAVKEADTEEFEIELNVKFVA